MPPEWNHPAIEQYNAIVADAESGVAVEKIADQLKELRAEIVRLAELDPRDTTTQRE